MNAYIRSQDEARHKIYDQLDITSYQEIDSDEWTSELNELMERAELPVQVTCFQIRAISDNFDQVGNILTQLHKYEDLEMVVVKISELTNHSDLIDHLDNTLI